LFHPRRLRIDLSCQPQPHEVKVSLKNYQSSQRQPSQLLSDQLHQNRRRDGSLTWNSQEKIVENPCGIGEYWPDKYKPWLGLLYGPLYLLCCALPYWLMVVPRPSIKNRLHIVLLAVGFLVIEWAVILGECTGLFGERDSYYPLCYYIDTYIALPLTIALASFVSWAVTTRVLQRFKRRV
jgi:hypothetical protein